MDAENLETFRSSLGGKATLHETTVEGFVETVTDAIEPPAVGTPLPFERVSLDDTPVETSFSPHTLERAQTGVTPATLGIADYGTVTIPSDSAGSELVSLYPPRHVVVLAASDVQPDMHTTYETLSQEFANGTHDTQVLTTGPSATADLGTLVEGVHGPHEVHIIVLEDT